MTVSNTYLAIHEEMTWAGDHYLTLAALAASDDPITAHRLRLMAELAQKIVRSTELRLRDIAATGAPS